MSYGDFCCLTSFAGLALLDLVAGKNNRDLSVFKFLLQCHAGDCSSDFNATAGMANAVHVDNDLMLAFC